LKERSLDFEEGSMRYSFKHNITTYYLVTNDIAEIRKAEICRKNVAWREGCPEMGDDDKFSNGAGSLTRFFCA
jgi:hypothetical protein